MAAGYYDFFQGYTFPGHHLLRYVCAVTVRPAGVGVRQGVSEPRRRVAE